jgi:integrase
MHRGKRVHRILPIASTLEQAHRFQVKLRQELFRVIDLGEAPAVSLWKALQRYVDDEVVHHKAARITKLKVASLESIVAGKSLAQVCEVADKLIRDRGELSAATINRKLSILKRVANLAYRKWGWLREPVADKIARLSGETERHLYLAEHQIDLLVRKIERQQSRDCVLIAAYTALRQGTIFSLPTKGQALTSDAPVVRADTVYLPDSKGGVPRAVPVIAKIRPAMRRWLALEKRVHPRTMYADFEAARDALEGKIPSDLVFHDLKHSTVSLLLQQGVPIYTVSKIAGHSITYTTSRYGHLELENLREGLSRIGRKTARKAG